jgi:hypothetical protein
VEDQEVDDHDVELQEVDDQDVEDQEVEDHDVELQEVDDQDVDDQEVDAQELACGLGEPSGLVAGCFGASPASPSTRVLGITSRP